MEKWIKRQLEPWKSQDYSECFAWLGFMAIGSIFGCIFADGYGAMVVGFGSLVVAFICAITSLAIARYKRRVRGREG